MAPLAHIIKGFDVNSYIDFGSVKGDTTSLEDRRKVPINSLVNSDYVFGESPRKSNNQNSILGTDFNNNIDNVIKKAIKKFDNAGK